MTKKPDTLTRVKKLQEIISTEEKAELTAFYNARQRTLQAYNEDSTAARKKDYDAARDGLNELIERLESAYAAPEDAPSAVNVAHDPTAVLFRNSTEMYDHLKEQGWGLSSRQTLTNHAKKGTLQLAPDRSITTEAFEAWKNNPGGGLKYYEAFVKHKRETLGTIEDNALKKSAEDLKTVEIKNRKLEREEQIELGKLITKEEAAVETCAWAALTRDTIARRVSQTLPDIIQATGGQQASLPEAQALLDHAIDQACNDIASSGEVDVVLDGEEEDDEHEP